MWPNFFKNYHSWNNRCLLIDQNEEKRLVRKAYQSHEVVKMINNVPKTLLKTFKVEVLRDDKTTLSCQCNA